MIAARTAQERSGHCTTCQQRTLIRRQRSLLGWGTWRCTVCGTASIPVGDTVNAPFNPYAVTPAIETWIFGLGASFMIICIVGFLIWSVLPH